MNPQESQSSAGMGNEPAHPALPPVGEPVWVKCNDYRTMAFLDEKGKWRNLVTREELAGAVQVIG